MTFAAIAFDNQRSNRNLRKPFKRSKRKDFRAECEGEDEIYFRYCTFCAFFFVEKVVRWMDTISPHWMKNSSFRTRVTSEVQSPSVCANANLGEIFRHGEKSRAHETTSLMYFFSPFSIHLE
jgi:hypothetical protein